MQNAPKPHLATLIYAILILLVVLGGYHVLAGRKR